MNVEAYKNLLLGKIPSAKLVSGGREINCRCMFCPDSRNPRSGHFYISLPQDDHTPSLYNCFKCHASGVVTYDKLIEWDIYDEEVAIDLINHNKNCSYLGYNKKYYNTNFYYIRHTVTTDSELSRLKLKYINDRLGCQFTYEELQRLKIVLNLSDLLNENNITNLTREPFIVEQLDKNFIGFISIDNAFLNMRRLCDEGVVYKSIDKRYINYKIIDKFDTSERFYTIPTTVDLSMNTRVKIHIAEGPFDILSIYKNVRHEEPGIYTSVGGSNIKGNILYFLQKYELPYSEIHIYPDNDQYGSTKRMQYIAQWLKPMRIPMYIHRNTAPNQKDFGVSNQFIQESIMEVT